MTAKRKISLCARKNNIYPKQPCLSSMSVVHYCYSISFSHESASNLSTSFLGASIVGVF